MLPRVWGGGLELWLCWRDGGVHKSKLRRDQWVKVLVKEYSVEGYGVSMLCPFQRWKGCTVTRWETEFDIRASRASPDSPDASFVHSTAQTAHQGDVTERPPVREPNGKCVARQPFSWLCNYPHREVKSLQQLRCSVGKAIDRRSKHCALLGRSLHRELFKSPMQKRAVWKEWHSLMSVIFQWKPVNAKNTPSGGGGCLEAAHVCGPSPAVPKVVPIRGECVSCQVCLLVPTGSEPDPTVHPPRIGAKCDSNLVDSASSHTLVSKIKPCMSKYKRIYTVKLRTAH